MNVRLPHSNPMHHLVVTLCLVIAVAWSFDGSVSADEAERPNVVFILADDLGYGDLGCYGRKDISTPHLDAMAKQGVRFTAHYANGAECTPTRAAFLTGRYQQWIGGLECAIGTGNVGRYDDAVRLRETHDLGLPTSIPTLPALLQQAGYETGIFGKWHLGYEEKFAPHLHGFDHSYYCVGGGMDYFHYIDNVAEYNLFRDGKKIQDDGYFTDRMTEEAIQFIQTSRDEPYFLYLPYTCPHSPFQGPDEKFPTPLPIDSPRWKQGSAPPDVYRSMIERMDTKIGEVLEAVDENTLVIFSSDNGGTKSARNEPYRGIKGSTFEGGIRVPAMLRWPSQCKGGVVCDVPTITFDWTKTILDVAGVASAKDDPLEGTNVLSILKEAPPVRTLYWRKPRGQQVWKGVRDGDLKYIADQRGDKELEYLFDLSTDESEQHNLVDIHPAEADRLRNKYLAWERLTRAKRRGRLEVTWRPKSPREEIQPRFSQDPAGNLIISTDDREGLMGWWEQDFDVVPGSYLAFSAQARFDGLKDPRRESVTRITWINQEGKSVHRETSDTIRFRPGGRVKAEPEFPAQTVSDARMATFEGTYRVPPSATKAKVELHLRWAPPNSWIAYENIRVEPVDDMPKKTVRIAAVHHRPVDGQTNLEKCEQFAGFIEQAGQQSVDLVVLPETLTYYGRDQDYVECAETIPGPSTEFFADLAKKNDLYIVAGLIERDQHLVYNTSVLVGPDGNLVGKYRKVSLPRSEIERGITPGDKLPVFPTRFGNVGMMICYDGFFPDVAKGLAEKGADVIAWPVWGCNPLLASARACENHVYVVSSTYTASNKNWIRSAIYGHDGKIVQAADDFGTMAIAEVDLNQRLHWESLGDFKAQLPAHRPVLSNNP